jgi:restriction system protein
LEVEVAEITRQRQGELVQAVLGVLAEHPDGLSANEVLVEVERRVKPTPFEQSEYPKAPGVRRFDKIVRFSTIGPVKAGWMVKSKGTWTITDDGRKALATFADPAEFMREADRLYRVWRKGQPEVDTDEGVEEVETATTVEEAEEAAWLEVSQYLQQMNPYEFQDLVAALLRAMNYHVSWVSPPGPDRGLDIVAYTDPLGATGPRIKVQVKRRADKTNVDGVRAFMALLGGQDVGIFISTGGFTSDAEREVRGQENRRISLIGLERLFDLWVEHYDAVPEEGRQLLPLKQVHFLAPQE